MTKNSFLRRTAMVVALFAAFAVTTFAQETRVSIQSNKSFDQTVAAFKMAVSKGGMMVMSTVDQGNMLKMTGLHMQGTLFLVGNPNVGKQVFEKDPAAGLYLPLRVYIYQSSSGTTFLSYDKPFGRPQAVQQRDHRRDCFHARSEARHAHPHGRPIAARITKEGGRTRMSPSRSSP